MFSEKKYAFPLIESILAFVIFLLHYTGLLDLTVYTASPFILLPLCIAIAVFRGELAGLIFGLVIGVACDACASSTTCFNSVTLMLTGFLVGILSKHIFNKNFKGTFALALLSCAVYFAAKWFIFYLLPDVQGKIYFLLYHSLTSAFYTTLFIIPFYYLEKWVLSERRPRDKQYIR
ncbi:MAG: hypothetical protein E7568_01960 [Ruminococcaceae bacterium]|nr:hypothetical protein [Oscillospiraceae bacterium]